RGADALHGRQVPDRHVLWHAGDARSGGRSARLSQDSDRRHSMKVRIDYGVCNSCGLCREVCPEMAIRPKLCEPRHLYEVQDAKCTGCGDCLDYCPAPGALVTNDAVPV